MYITRARRACYAHTDGESIENKWALLNDGEYSRYAWVGEPRLRSSWFYLEEGVGEIARASCAKKFHVMFATVRDRFDLSNSKSGRMDVVCLKRAGDYASAGGVLRGTIAGGTEMCARETNERRTNGDPKMEAQHKDAPHVLASIDLAATDTMIDQATSGLDESAGSCIKKRGGGGHKKDEPEKLVDVDVPTRVNVEMTVKGSARRDVGIKG
ncbi:hypothetical protein DFH07DRAFT_782416 [Mycena maculata]|uniref:Uncharacterized protein n=1 Tax=Mycena maculata TaxID=230809 RepID=A0AAD7HUY1_9AGAR|nr:hypothetical protein DFH07DRAFT_782416 [Mycena maculata]